MKAIFTLALLAVTTIASAQPGHHRGKGHGNGHKKEKHYNKHHHNDRYERYSRDDDDYSRNRRVVRNDYYDRDYSYRVGRELSRYDFLRLSRHQRSRLQVSLNFLVSNGYGPRDYESRLRRDLRDILDRSQYDMWERRAYGNNNTFVFNFGR
ncbi:hypothetical protein H1R17_13050 [Flavobacterium sp. xlx-214]|uniref:hypothetical protein n=1 Tax=unclassified Flavobacterium TaxID=196869 RepID=UPI0013D36F3C|nr:MULTISPECIES: hypothetical protein [unclassified Flavobacterium]MBA5791482.1 hypothetical protein [Flavobacterium sp. xlx-221]QMI83368.1 hypothetical protein H1R17_13050 [Flavobacterium sp. xlx-214]